MGLEVVDRLDISDLYARYSLAFDDGQADSWARLFTPDGSFFITDGPTIRGTDDLAGFAAKMHGRFPGIRHLVSGIRIEPAGMGARGTAYVVVLRAGMGARGTAYVVVLGAGDDCALRVLTLGRYEDEFVRTAEGWRFHTRTFSSWVAADSAGPALIGPGLQPADA